MSFAPLPRFAIGGDAIHGAGRDRPNTDPWWSALALGANGLACILDPDGDRIACRPPPAAPTAPTIPLDDFLWSFGQACPLAFIIPNETPLPPARIGAIIQRLQEAALAHPPHLLVPAGVLTDLALSDDTPVYVLNDYADPLPDAGQAWSVDSAASHFPEYPFPGEDRRQARLLLRRGRNGTLTPTAWLLTDYGGDATRPPLAQLLSDDFAAGTDSTRWVFGYSNPLAETFIQFGPASTPGLILDMPQGFGYSGGAGVLKAPLLTDFDARINFQADNTGPGLAFELAGITIDPPRSSLIDHHDTSADKYRSLVFDVHGAPPYVSSECDEGDGFRIGWNMACNPTYFVDQQAASMNMYNRYGADVGGPHDGHTIAGELRLVRRGDFWASYFRTQAGTPWRCSGTVHFPGLPQRIYLRLGAKHWPKGSNSRAAANRVRFTNAVVYIPAWSKP